LLPVQQPYITFPSVVDRCDALTKTMLRYDNDYCFTLVDCYSASATSHMANDLPYRRASRGDATMYLSPAHLARATLSPDPTHDAVLWLLRIAVRPTLK